MILSELLLLSTFITPIQCYASKRDHSSYDYYAIHLRSDADPKDVSNDLGLSWEGPLGQLPDHHIFSTSRRSQNEIPSMENIKRNTKAHNNDKAPADVLMIRRQFEERKVPLVKRMPQKEESEQVLVPPGIDQPIEWAVEESSELVKSLGIISPGFSKQWYLHNVMEAGHDLGVKDVWKQGISGTNSTICLLDDGLDMDNADIRFNYFAKGSWDFNNAGPDPKPFDKGESHGTRCATESSAGKDGVCGIGVAYNSRISGVRMLSQAISDADEAEALNYEFQQNQIYSCSWGPPDDGQTTEAPGILTQRALLNGVQNGRGGLGSIFVFDAGNGGHQDDNCNFDGWANSIYTIAVGSIDRLDRHQAFSEKCSAQLAVTYASGAGGPITNSATGSCYDENGGTFAAAPLLSGVYALMLDVNPSLTWRDVQWLTVLHSVSLAGSSEEQQTNSALEKSFSHSLGYGKIDAHAMVEAAKTWKSVKPQAWFWSPVLNVHAEVPQDGSGIASSYEVAPGTLQITNIARLEHVTVTLNVDHTRRGDLSVELHSPSGMISYLATPRRYDNTASGFKEWTFMTVAHWGESGAGNWTLVIRDTKLNGHSGKLHSWQLKLWGEAIYGARQPLLPMPNHLTEEETDDAETSAVFSTTQSMPSFDFGSGKSLWIWLSGIVIFSIALVVLIMSCTMDIRHSKKSMAVAEYRRIENGEEEEERTPLTS